MYVCITDSLCCTVGTKITLQINSTPIKLLNTLTNKYIGDVFTTCCLSPKVLVNASCGSELV